MLCYLGYTVRYLVWTDYYQRAYASGGMIMDSIDFGRVGVERRRYAVEEIRFSLARLYRGFVLWASMYGETDAREERERRTLRDPDTYEEMIEYLGRAAGFAEAPWCGGRECEAEVKAGSSATIRCLPLDEPDDPGPCLLCGSRSPRRALFARAY